MGQWRLVLVLVVLVGVAPAAVGDGTPGAAPWVVFTDGGLDDAVALALLLQAPGVDVHAVVAGEGVLAVDDAAALAAGLRERFLRPDVSVFRTSPLGQPLPPMRAFARGALRDFFARGAAADAPLLVPDVLAPDPAPTRILALGPLTPVARALEAKPSLAGRIAYVLAVGDPAEAGAWNLVRDRAALDAIRGLGVEVRFVAARGRAPKPAAWVEEGVVSGRPTSIAQHVLAELFASVEVRRHYVRGLDAFSDELGVLVAVAPSAFEREGDAETATYVPDDATAALLAFERILAEGRAMPDAVVLGADAPEAGLAEDVRVEREAILDANGRVEWRLQLRVHEFHQHLGTWTVLGAKMGLRAAELLNAPPHHLEVVSHVPLVPPLGCLNDGVIVATGSTPGRGLFRYEAEDDARVAVTFRHAGRFVTLALSDAYAHRVRAEIRRLLAAHGLEDAAYWEGVRRFAIAAWRDWHRVEIFEIVASGTT